MNKDEGNFWTGWFLGRMMGGRKNNQNNNGGGCFSSIIGLIIIGLLIYVGYNYGLKGVVICFVIIPFVIAGIYGWRKAGKDMIKESAQEAWELFQQGSYTLALEKAESVAVKNADAADLAGVLYLNGNGCDVNVEKAFSYFKMGQKKNMEARAYYGYMLLMGNGCEQNIEEGKKALISAYTAGKNTFAAMRIGEFQLTGEFGWNKDVPTAMKHLRVAVDDGWDFAKYLVGVMQYEGKDGVPQNQEQGFSLIQQAASAGITEAQNYLQSLNA